MELPDFSSLWMANDSLKKLKESIHKLHPQNSQTNMRNPRKRGPDTHNNYYSDGICGVSFGIAQPEFANPLAMCCEQHFFTAEEFDRHIADHVICPGLPGVEKSSCSRSIHPSVVAFHLETEHAKPITDPTNTYSDAALKRWRQARRRNYPTFERVQAKIREVGYRIDRGQVLLTKKFGSLNSRKSQELRAPRSTENKKMQSTSSFNNTICSVDQQSQSESLARTVATESPFDIPEGLQAANANDKVPVADDEVRSVPEGILRKEDMLSLASIPPPAPLSLVNYDSDVSWSEHLGEVEEGEPSVPSLTKKSLLEQLEAVQPKNAQGGVVNPVAEIPSNFTTPPERRRARENRFNKCGRRRKERRDQRKKRDTSDDEEGPTTGVSNDAMIEIDEVSIRGGAKAFATHPLVQMVAKRRACMQNASLISKRPTLLQMLLAEEMRHERNQMMQCVRYVVKNNFFLPK